ncbi:MAG: PKD domain-containing protein [Methanomicrobiales archaeon]
MLDGIGQYLYNKNAGLTWICQVNGVTLDDYGSPATDGLNLKSLSNGDQVNYYYGMKPVTPENATAVVKIKANISGQPPISDWTLSLVGAQSRSVTKTYFEQGLACPSSGHQVFWTDTDNNTWGGVPLWFLVGMVDDNPDVGPYHFNFNDTIAAQGYSVKVISADGWDTTLSSQNIARNDGYIVANTLNGQPLPRNTTSGKLSWPLHLKGSATFGGQQVGNITKIELTGLPKPVTAWTLTMKGEVTDNITQAYFVDAIACKHNVTWTDSNNDVWQGVALWDLVGAVDDIETTDHFTFNDTRAAENYTVRVSAGDGYNATFISSDVARNDGYIVAYRMNGVPITGSEAPLKLVGPSTTRGSQRIGNITMISLEGLPDQFPPGNWQLQLVGKISAVIPQPEFEYWASCHDATYTDTTGNVYTGVPLWRLMGWVDDRIPHGPNGFNDAAALAGYKVIVKAGDGYEKEFTSQQIGKNDNFIVADTMNGAPLPTTGSHPPYPLRLVGNDVIVANSVGNIVQIQLTDFQTPVTYPPVHIIKYAPDRITIINQTNVTYPWMEANLPVIGDGVTTYKFEGLTMDPSNLWDPEETYPGGFKISNVVKGTRVKDLVELVGGMGSGTEITFVSSDGLELPLPYSSIYTNPAVQDRQGDAILAWWGDGKYVPNYGDGIRLFFMPEGDHVYGQWDMHETLPPAYWHYNFQNGIQYPSCAGISAKFVTTVRVYSSPESDWSLELDGRDIGGINATISKTYFEDALACQFSAEHSTTYTDSSGQVWGGMPLWFLCGYVDDADQHSKQSYNESKALAGYNISVAGAGGDSYTIDSRNTIRNSNYIVANTLNGTHLSTTDPSWPLRLVGQNVSVTNSVKKVASVTLKQFTPNPATTSVQVIKYANDGRTILGQRTVDFQWMQANLPVYGDGVTHYYHQGPVMNASIPDKWNPEENDPAILTKDLGAVKGTNIQDLCNLAGGMSPGDYNVTLMASDGLSRPFSYASVYSPPPRAGPIVLTWYRADQGYVNNSYSEGMRNINFANTAVNPWGLNVFGVWDMHETYPEAFWYYYQPGLPSAMGVSIKNINRVLIYSAEPAPSAPVAAFTADVTSGQAPLTVEFTDTSSGNPTSWNWNFGDGTANVTTKNPSHLYQNTGTYDVTLTASNADGSSTLKKSHYISVISPGTISVTVIKYANDGRTILGQRTVDFQWMQANLPVYGDGVTHYYHQGPVMNASIPDKWNPEENDPAILTKDLGAVKGTNIQDLCNLAGGMSPEDYNVTLMASDGLSRPFSYSSVYSPAPRAGPIVLTWYRADQGYVNNSYSEGMRNINFANTAVNPWGLNVFGVWDMHETYPEAFWYYYQPGLPSAMGVSIKNINRVLIYSAEPAPSAPVAAFTADVTSGQAPLTVEFTDTSSGNPTSWNWNFGDGTANVTTKNPSHLYQNTGTYDVTLTASNADGSSTLKKSQYISVRSPGLYADFTVSPVSGTAPLAVECADKSSGKPIFYLYNFGDGLYGTSPNSVHLYQFPGTYDITLTIMAFDRTTFSMKSSTMTKKNVVTVNSVPFIPPVAKFTASPVQGTSPLTVKFTDQSTGSPTFYSYNFGDGITRPGPNQDHIYQFPGTYTVTLTVMKNDGKGSIVSDTSIRKDLIVVQSK